MEKIVDARGLSCPQPVLVTLEAIKKASESEFILLVDTDTSRENVIRAAETQGFTAAEIQEESSGYRITLKKT